MATVCLEAVRRSYDDGATALADIHLEIADGELLALVGQSGSGKSTLLRVIAGLEPVDAGVVRINGRVVNSVPARDRGVGMVFQDQALYPTQTVRGNLGFGLRLRRGSKQAIEQRVETEARLLRLSDLLDQRPRALSAGHRQATALGRATIQLPEVLLLDEPLANLDAHERARLRGELARLLRTAGTTVVYATNDPGEGMVLGDRLAVLAAGRLHQVAAPLEVYDRPADTVAASLLGSPPMNLLPARVEVGDRAAWARVGGQAIRLVGRPPSALRLLDGLEVVAGIRPEHLHAAGPDKTEQALHARVLRARPLGAEQHVTAALSRGAELIARIPVAQRYHPDDAITLSFDAQRLHLFDADSGLRLDVADPV